VIAAARALWAGEIPLVRAFWDFAIIGGLGVNSVATLGAVAVLAADAPALLALAVHLAPTPYNLLVLVGVWRSAGAYRGHRLWAHAARLSIVLWVAAAAAL
jgi:hypothetical protein